MARRLEGRTALITGAGSGIGAAISEAYAREGASVCCVDIYACDRDTSIGPQGPKTSIHDRQDEGQTIDEKLREKYGARAIFVRADVSQDVEVAAAVQQCVKEFGRLDIMVNNAGITHGTSGPGLLRLHELSENTYDQVMAVNAKGVFLGCKHALEQMLQQQDFPHGSEKTMGDSNSQRPCRGWIINMGSVMGLNVFTGVPSYCASKGAVVMLTKQVAYDYAKDNICCNALCPGLIKTPLTEGLDYQTVAMQKLHEKHLLDFGNVEDVAKMAVVLASDDAKWMTGVALPVDGGFLLG